jgi:hypothetical protein
VKNPGGELAHCGLLLGFDQQQLEFGRVADVVDRQQLERLATSVARQAGGLNFQAEFTASVRRGQREFDDARSVAQIRKQMVQVPLATIAMNR